MAEDNSKIPDAFYDIHLHAYNLSHPGLLLFLSRFLKKRNLSLRQLISVAYYKLIMQFIGDRTGKKLIWILSGLVTLIVASLICPCEYAFHLTLILLLLVAGIFLVEILQKIPANDLRPILNVFTIFENEEVMQFLYLERDYMMLSKPVEEKVNEYIAKCKNEKKALDYEEMQEYIKETWQQTLDKGGFEFETKNNRFDKVIISPLVMDFSSRGFDELGDLPYNFPPKKTVVNQTIDLFRGMHQYYYYSKFKLMEIIPFLGIKPKDLTLEGIKDLLNDYFSDLEASDSPDVRYGKIMQKKKNCFGEKIEKNLLLDRKKFYYAGIKIYPPLDVDPWPDDTQEREKIKYIFDYCISKRIPVTTHCSDGGFKVMKQDNHDKYTNPMRWKQALDCSNMDLSKLTLNFAHCGIQLKTRKKQKGWAEWLDAILDIMKSSLITKEDSKEYSNVYMDISDIGGEGDASYENFISAVNRYIGENIPENKQDEFRNILKKSILFGTDHMMNLFHIDSYKKHLELFRDDKGFTDKLKLDKKAFYTTNPRRFLFGS